VRERERERERERVSDRERETFRGLLWWLLLTILERRTLLAAIATQPYTAAHERNRKPPLRQKGRKEKSGAKMGSMAPKWFFLSFFLSSFTHSWIRER
jgi:hypothetical protein